MALIVIRGSRSINRKTDRVALSQALFSKDPTCLNDERPTRLVSRPGDTDGVIDLLPLSSAEASVSKFEVLAEQERDLTNKSRTG